MYRARLAASPTVRDNCDLLRFYVTYCTRLYIFVICTFKFICFDTSVTNITLIIYIFNPINVIVNKYRYTPAGPITAGCVLCVR